MLNIKKSKRVFKWRSTFMVSLEYSIQALDETELAIFNMLYNGYGVPQKLQSAYFQLLRVGDGKYTLTVQKYLDDTYSIIFEINPNYANNLERFTK